MQTGGVLCAIHPGKGIDLRQKILPPTQTFTLSPARYALSDNPTPDKSFREIKALCHTAAKCYQL
ncbi:hypothetical protein DN619_26200 [Klebsiella michiganensis]|nr:hypothetical protein DN619_26200 [Klebsiella michiganensis]